MFDFGILFQATMDAVGYEKESIFMGCFGLPSVFLGGVLRYIFYIMSLF